MHRIIKFRVWDKQINEMVQWDDVRETELLDDSFDGKDAVAMQFTGLKDKNGIDIYEGDIIEVRSDISKIGYIIFNTNQGRWNIKVKDDDFDYAVFEGACINFSIIGNIFENPELLNAKQTTN